MTPVLIQQKVTEVRAAAGNHNAECTGLFLIPVKLVQHAVQYRREYQPSGNQEHQACVQRVQTREQLTPIGSRGVDWPHSAQQHGGVEKRVAPGKSFEIAVPRHSKQKRAQHQSYRARDVPCEAPSEIGARQGRVFARLVHSVLKDVRLSSYSMSLPVAEPCPRGRALPQQERAFLQIAGKDRPFR